MASAPNNPFENQGCLPSFLGNEAHQPDVHGSIQSVAPGIQRKRNADMIRFREVENLLSSDMSKLSVQERASALDDVHCVGEELKETPETVQQLLAEFEETVQSQQHQHPIYALALNQNRAYVEDSSFRLKFLRANLHNVQRAVSQMMDLLRNKAKYFGQDTVTREITTSDLTEDDIDLMLSARYFIPQERDRMGRPVAYIIDRESRHGIYTKMRVAYYVFWNMLISQEDAQKKGVALILYNPFRITDFHYFREAAPVFGSFPLRPSSTHICMTTSCDKTRHGALSDDSVLCFILKSAPLHGRVRSRIHIGSNMEIQYQLRSHGIPSHTFPLDEEGNLRAEILNGWIAQNNQDKNVNPIVAPMDQSADDNTDESSRDQQPQRRGIIPTDTDVLLGRGYRLQTHAGNIRFRDIVEQNREEYDNAQRQRRRFIATRLAQAIRDSGVRFLKMSPSGEWVIETDLEEAATRVSQVFRSIRKRESRY